VFSSECLHEQIEKNDEDNKLAEYHEIKPSPGLEEGRRGLVIGEKEF
jgi:hypothetical protein